MIVRFYAHFGHRTRLVEWDKNIKKGDLFICLRNIVTFVDNLRSVGVNKREKNYMNRDGLFKYIEERKRFLSFPKIPVYYEISLFTNCCYAW